MRYKNCGTNSHPRIFWQTRAEPNNIFLCEQIFISTGLWRRTIQAINMKKTATGLRWFTKCNFPVMNILNKICTQHLRPSDIAGSWRLIGAVLWPYLIFSYTVSKVRNTSPTRRAKTYLKLLFTTVLVWSE
jgi:hypothetical protein